MTLFVLQEPDLQNFDNSAQIFNCLSDAPSDVQDVESLIDVSSLSVIINNKDNDFKKSNRGLIRIKNKSNISKIEFPV